MTRVDAVSVLLRARDEKMRRGQASIAESVAAFAVQDLIDYAESALPYVSQCVSRDKATHAANGSPKSEPLSAVVAAGLSNALERLGVDPQPDDKRIFRAAEIDESAVDRALQAFHAEGPFAAGTEFERESMRAALYAARFAPMDCA